MSTLQSNDSSLRLKDRESLKLGSACDPSHAVLLVASNQLHTSCGYTTWCDGVSHTCKARGCRRDEYPFGYSSVDHHKWPPKCEAHQFCPDEGSSCMDRIPLGGACQLNRDDQCATTQDHHNVKCLHNVCVAVNATLGRACINENVIYTFFTQTNTSAGSIISRDNCIPGLYCDSPSSTCLERLPKNSNCSADKECQSTYCSDASFVIGVPVNNDPTGTCSDPPFHMAHKRALWVYPVVVLSALSLFVLLLAVLFKVHHWQMKARRKEEKEYWESQRDIVADAQAVKKHIRVLRNSAIQDPNQRRMHMFANPDPSLRTQFSTNSLTNLLERPIESTEVRSGKRQPYRSDLDPIVPISDPFVGDEIYSRRSRLAPDIRPEDAEIPLAPIDSLTSRSAVGPLHYDYASYPVAM